MFQLGAQSAIIDNEWKARHATDPPAPRGHTFDGVRVCALTCAGVPTARVLPPRCSVLTLFRAQVLDSPAAGRCDLEPGGVSHGRLLFDLDLDPTESLNLNRSRENRPT